MQWGGGRNGKRMKLSLPCLWCCQWWWFALTQPYKFPRTPERLKSLIFIQIFFILGNISVFIILCCCAFELFFSMNFLPRKVWGEITRWCAAGSTLSARMVNILKWEIFFSNFQFSISAGGPTLYSHSNRTAVTADAATLILYIVFITLFLAFVIIFPGVR